MDILDKYQQLKRQNNELKYDRHLYVANILKELFPPNQHEHICEIGAGRLELAYLLANIYKRVDAYEINPPKHIKKISNLKIYDLFYRYVDVSKYHLLVSVCPYSYCFDDYSDYNPEEETQNLVTDILDLSIKNSIDSFIILTNKHSTNEILKEINSKSKYSKIIQDDIKLYYKSETDEQIHESHNKILIYKK